MSFLFYLEHGSVGKLADLSLKNQKVRISFFVAQEMNLSWETEMPNLSNSVVMYK